MDQSWAKVEHCGKSFKYFIGYTDGSFIRSLCIVLPQMSGFLKYFDNGGKNMSFMARDNNVLVSYNEIWDKIKELIDKKLDSEPIYDGKYIKSKVRLFDGVVFTNFHDSEIPRGNMHYVYFALITIDSVMKMDKKYYPQVYLGECKDAPKKN